MDGPPEPAELTELVVIGASAGGVTAMQRLLRTMPAHYRGTICFVLHLSPNRPSHLTRVLSRGSALPVRTAEDGAVLLPGHVYIAPPDRHLTVVDHRVALDAGPTENGHRPSVDVLFRTAAHALGPAVSAVVLSGSLDDGAAGIREVKARGGRAVVHRPEDADYDGMPLAALEVIHPDHVGTPEEIGEWLVQRGPGMPEVHWAPPPEGVAPIDIGQKVDTLSCPHCHGALHDISEGSLMRYQCLIGHKWSGASLESAQRTATEEALWAAVRSLEEQALLNRRLADRSARLGHARAAESFGSIADQAADHAANLRSMAEEVGATPADELDHAS